MRNIENILCNVNLEKSIEGATNVLMEIIDKHCPKVSRSARFNTWWDSKLQNLKKEINGLYRLKNRLTNSSYKEQISEEYTVKRENYKNRIKQQNTKKSSTRTTENTGYQ